jgi:hypothetical protein
MPAMLVDHGGIRARKNEGFALLACVFVTFFRKSNTTSEGACPFGAGKCVRACDVTEAPRKYALRVTTSESKIRQFGKCAVIWTAGVPGHPLDPVAAWRAHADYLKHALRSPQAPRMLKQHHAMNHCPFARIRAASLCLMRASWTPQTADSCTGG